MIKQVVEKANLNWHEIKASLKLDKTICIGEFREKFHAQGHFSDYLSGIQPCVAVRALKDTHLSVWESSSLLTHCSFNDALNVSFYVEDELKQDSRVMNVESWSGNNGFIVRRSKDGCEVTYYFSLLHSHAQTGELSVSPCFYFIENPDFKLSTEAHSSISELLKINPLRLEVKENQVVCFDKFHYQMEYNPDFSFIRAFKMPDF